MKSITYLFTGTPTRLDDCLDLAAKASSAPAVSLSLKYTESCRETDILTQMVGTYRWIFDKKKISIEVIYGGLFMLTGRARRSRIIDRSNRRLAKDLSRISCHGITITGAVRQFDDFECCTSSFDSPPATSCA